MGNNIYKQFKMKSRITLNKYQNLNNKEKEKLNLINLSRKRKIGTMNPKFIKKANTKIRAKE